MMPPPIYVSTPINTDREFAMLWSFIRNRIPTWVYDYFRLPPVIVIFIYAQVGCALIGSLGENYSGILLTNLGIAIFARLAIEINNHTLCRAYMFLHFFAILLDISWFIFFFIEIWKISSKEERALYIVSVQLTLLMEFAGFVIKLYSSVLWLQIYGLGAASTVDTSLPRQSDSDLRNSFLEPPSPVTANQRSRSEEILRETPLFGDGERNLANQRSRSEEVIGHHTTENILNGSPSSSAESSQNLESPQSGLH